LRFNNSNSESPKFRNNDDDNDDDDDQNICDAVAALKNRSSSRAPVDEVVLACNIAPVSHHVCRKNGLIIQ
jgi:hypothetical protein